MIGNGMPISQRSPPLNMFASLGVWEDNTDP